MSRANPLAYLHPGSWVDHQPSVVVLRLVRLVCEEQALAEAFGDEWRTYADRVGRWVPNVPKGGFGHGW